MRTIRLITIIALPALAGNVAAADYYVATTGSAAGNGSLADPWDLQTALSHPPALQPGDTLWVRGGTYVGAHTSLLAGSSTQPITVRSYRRERVIVDYANNTNCNPGEPSDCSANNKRCNALTVPACSHDVVFRDLEILSSEAGGRVSVPAGGCTQAPNCCYVDGNAPPLKAECGPAPSGIARAQWNPLQVLGKNIKLINCVVHDGGTGITSEQLAVDTEIYGALSFNNGWVDPAAGHGHGANVENVHVSWNPSHKLVRNSAFWNNFGDGYHSSADWGKFASNLVLENIVSFNNGAPAAAFYAAAPGTYPTQQGVRFGNLVLESKEMLELDTIRGCRLYHPMTTAPTGGRIGASGFEDIGLMAGDVIVEDSYFASAGTPLYLERIGTLRLTGNTLVGGATPAVGDSEAVLRVVRRECNSLLEAYSPIPYSLAIDYNAYYFNGSGTTPFLFESDSAHRYDLAGWKSAIRNGDTYFDTTIVRDASSTYSAALPSTNAVFVQPNVYEPGRALVAVYNWQNLASVSVNLATAGLAAGQSFKIYNLQAFQNSGSTDYFGTIVATGTYNPAQPSISVPMTDATVTAPIGFPYAVSSTLPQFGAFLVRSTPCGDGVFDSGEACDDGNLIAGDGCTPACAVEQCWTCSGAPSACSPLSNGTACDDGLYCNGVETCVAGVCQHPGDPCAGGPACQTACNETANDCLNPAASPCPPDANPCTDDVCNGSGSCTHPANTAPCSDGNACTVGDVCSGGICQAGPPLACDDGLFCNGVETCFAGNCQHSGNPCAGGIPCHNGCNEAADNCLNPAGSPCPIDANLCTADVCDGNGMCTHPATTEPCDDNDACTTGDTCSGGVCQSGPPTNCNDGSPCTQDSCDSISGCLNAAVPVPNCEPADKTQFSFKEGKTDAFDKLQFKWTSGLATPSQLADPTTDANYSLCVYDAAGLVLEAVVPAGGACKTVVSWCAAGDGYKYSNKGGTHDGINALQLKGHATDPKAKVQLKGKGVNLPDPTLELAEPVTVQMMNDATGWCLETEFAGPQIRSNDGDEFKAKTP